MHFLCLRRNGQNQGQNDDFLGALPHTFLCSLLAPAFDTTTPFIYPSNSFINSHMHTQIIHIYIHSLLPLLRTAAHTERGRNAPSIHHPPSPTNRHTQQQILVSSRHHLRAAMKKASFSIKNKCKRREVYAKVKAEKKKTKKTERAKRQREAEELGEEAPPKQVCMIYIYTHIDRHTSS